jgi:hypothetical protein
VPAGTRPWMLAVTAFTPGWPEVVVSPTVSGQTRWMRRSGRIRSQARVGTLMVGSSHGSSTFNQVAGNQIIYRS